MTPEERQLLQQLERDVKDIKNYTSNLGGSLEFRKLVQQYVLGTGGLLEVGGILKHTGTTAGFLGKSPVVKQAKIGDPTGGATIDSEARTAINSIIDVLEAFGFTSLT